MQLVGCQQLCHELIARQRVLDDVIEASEQRAIEGGAVVRGRHDQAIGLVLLDKLGRGEEKLVISRTRISRRERHDSICCARRSNDNGCYPAIAASSTSGAGLGDRFQVPRTLSRHCSRAPASTFRRSGPAALQNG